jgi:negative regulator of sigma E activity
MDPPDELEEYLRGDSALSRRYRAESAPAPPHVLDRRVLRLSREAQRTAQSTAQSTAQCTAQSTARCTAQRLTSRLQPLAFAACVLLSVALVLAIVFGPQTAKRTDDNAPRLVRVAARAEVSPNASLNHRAQLYGGDLQRPRAPAAWLADIAALRRAGRNSEADAEYRRFRSVYPGYTQAGGADHSNALVIGP